MTVVALYSISRDLVKLHRRSLTAMIYMEKFGKSVNTTRKSAIKFVNLPSFRLIRLKRGKIWLRKFAKIYRPLYDGGQVCVVQIFCAELYHFPTFQLDKFTNFEALFPVVSTDFPKLVHVKSWKSPWKRLESKFHWQGIQNPKLPRITLHGAKAFKNSMV